ncbi:UPF0585 protein CG18661 isoform X2 [Drosophila tropicalis]|uniref:UPF0585 protein CG18661 isoform X2 n=1 Tax=Drosophila tropicalis TaxID=46794 RepID=UPI0035ABB875
MSAGGNSKLYYPSADRNSQPIADALLAQIDRQTLNLNLLEIASGSGQHTSYLAALLPNIIFQPTEYDKGLFSSITAYVEDSVTGNINPPIHVDISQDVKQWKVQLPTSSYDYMFNSNMMHISPWTCSIGLFRAAGELLKPGGKLFTYGPYAKDGVLTPQSNVDFDQGLKRRDPSWGVRDIRDLKELAEANGLKLEKLVDMPSNNKFLTWLKL